MWGGPGHASVLGILGRARELLKGLNVFVIRMGISRRDQCSPWRERILAFLLQVLLASVPGAARRDMTSPEERKMHVSR